MITNPMHNGTLSPLSDQQTYSHFPDIPLYKWR